MKKLLIALVVGCLLGVGGVILCDLFMNPGRAFFARVFDMSDQWAAQLRSESDAPCYILDGSSDVRMSIDPAVMKSEYGLRAINAGAHAGNGANVNFLLALNMARAGDTLVSFPVALWQPADDNLPAGVKFLISRCGMRSFEPGVLDFNAKHLLYPLRGNAGYELMHLGKLLTNVPTAYKYDRISTVHASGWVEVRYTMKSWRFYTPENLKCLEVKDSYQHQPLVHQKCMERGIHHVVQIPRCYDRPHCQALAAFQALYLVRHGIPVLKDRALGVEADMQMMGDTSLHHNAQGSLKYSRVLARLLSAGEYWTEAELVEELRSRGWNEDGTPASPQPASAL